MPVATKAELMLHAVADVHVKMSSSWRRLREPHQLHCGAAQGRHPPLSSLWCSLLSSWSCPAGGGEDGQLSLGFFLVMLNVFAVFGADTT